ncbi:hypothetical protein EQG41_18175 [Billgrantia azerbaijanica]|nr:hypothetical protein EQG41_18175 [Halomonas azerbaijanica]
MKPLTYSERATLRRHHGLEVLCERQDGTATCLDRDGNRVRYATERLRYIANPSWQQRLRSWLAEVGA